jgi:hypothetical protein
MAPRKPKSDKSLVRSKAAEERAFKALNLRTPDRMAICTVAQADERTVLRELRFPGSVKGAVGARIREYLETGRVAERAADAEAQ